MDVKDKLKKVTQYKEQSIESSTLQISYMDFKEITFEEKVREAKQNLRQKSINYIENNISKDVYEKAKDNLKYIEKGDYFGEVISELKLQSFNSKPLINYHLIYDEVIDIIKTITNGKKVIDNITLRNIDKNKVINSHMDERQITELLYNLITNSIIHYDNMMNLERVNYNQRDKVLIMGTSLIPIIEMCMGKSGKRSLGEYTIIYEENIPKNKIILIRNCDTSINLIVDEVHNNYFLGKTDKTDKNMVWFDVIGL